MSERTYQKRSHDSRVLAEDVEEAVVLVGVFLGDELAVFRAGKRLDAALEQAHANGKDPELQRAFQKERGEQHDADICSHAYLQHALGSKALRQVAVGDGRGERHELRHQKRQHQLRRIDAQIGAVAGGHLDNRMHAVDVEEERQHEEQQALVAHDAFHRLLQTGKRGAQNMVGALLAVQLLDIFGNGDGEGDPPSRRDDERDLHAQRGIDAEARSAQDNRQARDERDARADITPGIPMGRHLVIAVFRGGIHQKGIVEHHRPIEHDGRYHVHHQERQGVLGNAQSGAGNRSRPRKTHQELLLVARQIGQAAQHRHKQRQHQRGHGFGVPPGHNHRRTRFGDRGEIHGDQCRGQHDEGRVSHIVENPAQLLLREPECHNRYPFAIERAPVWSHHETETSIRFTRMGYLK